jgi:hypothetical protein
MNEPKLPVVIPYFNHTNARVNRRLLEESLDRLALNPNCAVVLAEGIWNPEAELPDFSQRVHRHLKYRYPQALWVKENLINLALRDCGMEWECAAWIDKDVEFLDEEWALKTRDALRDHDIIQPWSRAVCTGELGGGHTISDYLEGYEGTLMHDDAGMMSWCMNPGEKDEKKGYCGFAWAATRAFLERVGGLYDRCLLGGGDGYLKASLHGHDYQLGPDFPSYYGDFQGIFPSRCRGSKIGFTDGKIVHHYHGKISNRFYNSRYGFALENGFDAAKDIDHADDGTIRLQNSGMEKAVEEYFFMRKEYLTA